MIAYESGVTAVIDPLAGSYYVETLTNEIERRALEYLAQIDAMGGMLRAIESGFVQQEIQNAAYEFQKSVDSREQVLVGVNAFQVNPEEAEQETPVALQRIDPELERRQVERLRAFRTEARTRAGAGSGAPGGGARAQRRQPDAGDCGSGGERCHTGRDLRCHAAGVWGTQGSAGDLEEKTRAGTTTKN